MANHKIIWVNRFRCFSYLYQKERYVRAYCKGFQREDCVYYR